MVQQPLLFLTCDVTTKISTLLFYYMPNIKAELVNLLPNFIKIQITLYKMVLGTFHVSSCSIIQYITIIALYKTSTKKTNGTSVSTFS